VYPQKAADEKKGARIGGGGKGGWRKKHKKKKISKLGKKHKTGRIQSKRARYKERIGTRVRFISNKRGFNLRGGEQARSGRGKF